jgi:hypothetical protein
VTTAVEPKLAELDGRWRLEVNATDKFGNVSPTPMNLEWDQYLIDGPVKVEEIPVSVGSTNFQSWGIVNPLPYGLESGKDMTPWAEAPAHWRCGATGSGTTRRTMSILEPHLW